MADFNKPDNNTLKTEVLGNIQDRAETIAKMVAPTANIPVDYKRFNATTGSFENWNGASWDELDISAVKLGGLLPGQFLRSDVDDNFSANLTINGTLGFEGGDHAITYNDGNGNFNIRVGHDSTEKYSDAKGAIHVEFSHEANDPSIMFHISEGQDTAIAGNPVNWIATFEMKENGDFEATRIVQGGVSLDDTYLGKTARAADSNKLDNLDSSQFLRSDADDTTSGILVSTNKIQAEGELVISKNGTAGSGINSTTGSAALKFQDTSNTQNVEIAHDTFDGSIPGGSGYALVVRKTADNSQQEDSAKLVVEGEIYANSGDRVLTTQDTSSLSAVDIEGVGLSQLLRSDQSGTLAGSLNMTGNDLTARAVKFDNLEGANLDTDGQVGFDTSQGMIIYRSQQNVTGAPVTVLDGANVEAGSGITISNLGSGATGSGSGTEKFTFSVDESSLNANTVGGLSASKFLRTDQADIITYNDTTADTLYKGLTIDYNVSGSDALTANREHVGLYIDTDSSASGGSTTSEHRLYGIYSNVTASGDSDIVYGSYNYARSILNIPGAQTTTLKGAYNYALADNTDGTLKYVQGSGNSAIVDGVGGICSAAYGSNNTAIFTANPTSPLNVAYGTMSEVQQDNPSHAINSAYANRASIDTNGAGGIGTGYLYYGDYQGALPTNAWGVYIASDVKSYFGGEVQIQGDLRVNGDNFYGDDKEAFRFSDGWLRLNPGNDFASGIYGGTSILRTDGEFQIGNSGATLKVNGTTFTYKGNKIWHEGNDGAASGLNADLLDGKHASSFVKNFEAGNVGVTELGRYLDMHTTGSTADFDVRLDCASADVLNVVGGALQVEGNTVWHSGNDGADSGLNADLLDGVHKASFLRSDADDYKTAGLLRFNDNIYLNFGTGNDVEHFWNGANYYTDINGGGNWYIRDGANANASRFTFAVATGDFTATGNVTAYSDERVKKDITRIENALSKVKAVSGYTFERTDMETQRQTGVIAQEILKVLPEAVSADEDGNLSVAYGNLSGMLIEAIKEQAEVAETQREEIKALRSEMEELKDIISSLKDK